MIVFDKANVHFMWDDSLVGRHCYYADTIDELVEAVTSQEKIGVISKFGDNYEPFCIENRGYYCLVYPTDVENQNKYSASYVHFEWDPSLEGKNGFLGNNIDDIITKVCSNATPEPILRYESRVHPFKDKEEGAYKFAYFDPYYSFRNAFLNGEPVQYLDDRNVWRALENCVFNLPISHYRFNYEEESLDTTSTEACNPVYAPVTNMELSRWLAEGHGYVLDTVNGNVITYFQFNYVERNNRFDNNRFLLRDWNSEL